MSELLQSSRELIRSSTQMPSKREDYVELVTKSIDWMEAIGVNVHSSSRYNSYRKTLNMYATGKPPKESNSWGRELSKEIVNAKYEAHEIDRIRRYFEGYEPDGITDKLQLVVNGPIHFDKEMHNSGKSALARNTQLELYIGGYMRRFGFDISYGGHKHPEPLVEVDGKMIGFECKRLAVAKPKAIRRNIERAAKQLEERISDGYCETGISHKNISKILNPRGMTLMGSHEDDLLASEARFNALQFFRSFAEPFPFQDHNNIEALTVNYSHLANFNPGTDDDQYVQHMMEKERQSGSSLVSAARNVLRENNTTDIDGYVISSKSLEVSD